MENPGSAKTLSQKAYLLLRAGMLSGELPPGSRLRIEKLKAKYEIGPTPIREALSRLASEGFVCSEQNRGFSIPPVSRQDLRDITDQRKLIECTALRTAIENIDLDYEADLMEAYYNLARLEAKLTKKAVPDLSEWEDLHSQFHKALIQGAKSPWLNKFQEILYDQSDRYRRLFLSDGKIPEPIHTDHKKILDATLAHNADLACELLADHIERVHDIVVETYFSKQEQE